MLADYFKLALNNLRRRRTRSYLTMIGIFIGIAAVVSLIGLGQGLRQAITGQFGFLGPDVLSVQAAGLQYAGPPGSGVTKPLTSDLADKIAKVPGVETAFNRYISTGRIEFNNRQEIGFAGSVPEGEKRKFFESMVNIKAEQGRLLKDEDTRAVVIGNNYRKSDTFGKPVQVGDTILWNRIPFRVVGILEKKGSFLFDSVILINERTMIVVLGKNKDEVSVIAVKAREANKINDVKEGIEKLLRKERKVKKGEEDFTVQSPQKILESLNSALFAVQLFVTIIATISLVVGGIGIMNTMYTAVLERTSEIGILKSIGARNSAIFLLFFMESGLLGMVGGIIGILLGMGFAYGLAGAARAALGSNLIQASISPLLVLMALLFSFFLGTIFGVLPAYQASRLNPVDSLRSTK